MASHGFSVSLSENFVNTFVHLVDVFLEKGLDPVSLHLEGRGKAVVFNRELLGRDKNVSRSFNAVESMSGGSLLDLSLDSLLHVGISGKSSKVLLFVVLLSPGEDRFVNDSNHNGVTLEGATVNKALSNQGRKLINTLKFGGGNILSLR